MNSSTLDSFMQLKGIDPHFIDAWGKPATVTDENVNTLINHMGFDALDEAALSAHYQQEETQHWLSLLPPVCVWQKASNYQIEVHLPIDFVTDALVYRITTEDGLQIDKKITATDFPLLGCNEISDVEFQLYAVTLEVELDIGYHQLTLLEEGNDQPLAVMSLVITPTVCFTPPAIREGKKLWGTSVQLYGIKSQQNWGIGDFSDLKELLTKTAESGGDFIGLNPIHALSPSQPNNASPYSPSSRKWLNILYIDITEIPELQHCQVLQNKLASAEFQQALTQLQDLKWVDYESVARLKLAALRDLFITLHDGEEENNKRLQKLSSFVAEKGDSLKEQAAYDALQFKFFTEDEQAWGWPVWPDNLQSFSSTATQDWCSENAQEIIFWSYCQWIAEEQLAEADKLAKSLGMTLGIYRDLAVGVTKNSSEVWANRDLYCENISIGAPPDVLGPLGQSWGLPPLSPDQLYKSAYQPFIELLQANMQYCGALRIDHVMALLRLWWVPEGETADGGAYVYYNVYDMLNLLALESVRNECLVIGEDLGTVPDGMDVLLKEAGVYSYKVFFFEQAEDGGFISPSHYEQQAMATLSTHDMPTIKGYWHCEDLYLGRELGLYPDPEVFNKLLVDRVNAKQQILDSLHGHHSLPDDFPRDANYIGMDQVLNFALQKHLARGCSTLLTLQLEDFLEMEQPVNVPGTSDEYRNWQRKLTHDVDSIFKDTNIHNLLKELTEARSK
ncbi:4-alpha-glucanotransferase [Psychromonas sp. RZ22]|uniref:4-alpha-glucanotransferase n=1 Tax=Psychromonas algarum TaxID=2555643 RepID=UPI00106848EC|nr:4-alpha-glucanotransferase [Psychromonas sp. RZ22]TEW56032.1 4-alpha-glucanotransferase [Psychromonas sp. RZ22]